MATDHQGRNGMWPVAIVACVCFVATLIFTGSPGSGAAPAQVETVAPAAVETATVYAPPPHEQTSSISFATPGADGPGGDPSTPELSNTHYYTDSDGDRVHAPAYTPGTCAAAGATARCGDGTCSFSQHHQGTCSRHGGVAEWM